MQVPPPEIRQCVACQNALPLNLFSLNSSNCRFCENGLEVPKRLCATNTKDKINDTSANLESNYQTQTNYLDSEIKDGHQANDYHEENIITTDMENMPKNANSLIDKSTLEPKDIENNNDQILDKENNQ